MYMGFNYTENKLRRTWMPPSFDIYYCNTSRFGLQSWAFHFLRLCFFPMSNPIWAERQQLLTVLILRQSQLYYGLAARTP